MVWVLTWLKRGLFPIQCENIIHSRHLMLYKCLAEGRVLYRLYYSSRFPVTSLPSHVPRSCPVPVDILSSDGHWADHVHVAISGPFLGSGWWPRTPLEAPVRHHEIYLREKPQPALRLLHATWRHQTQSRQWADSSVPRNVCLKSNLLKSAKRQWCAQNLHGVWLSICCIPLSVLVLSPFPQHRPSPWVEKYKRKPPCSISHPGSGLMDLCLVTTLK